MIGVKRLRCLECVTQKSEVSVRLGSDVCLNNELEFWVLLVSEQRGYVCTNNLRRVYIGVYLSCTCLSKTDHFNRFGIVSNKFNRTSS